MKTRRNGAPCYCATVRRASRAINNVYDRMLEPVGLTSPQLSLLRQIDRAGAVNVTRLAELSGLERTTMGRNLRVLEKMDLVVSGPSETDTRERLFELTAAGHKMMERAGPLWRKAQQMVEAQLGPQKLETLRRLLADVEALST